MEDCPYRCDEQPLDEHLAKVEAEWDQSQPSDWLDPIKDASNLAFTYLSHRPDGVPQDGEDEWLCQLVVVAQNIPRLMRRGFHWSSEDIVLDKGAMTFNDPDLRDSISSYSAGWLHTRTYYLRHLDTDTYWLARLILHTRKEELLHTFDPSIITKEHTQCCVALDWQQNLVYYFDRIDPDSSLNTIYDNMILDGWWPWPKEKEEPSLERPDALIPLKRNFDEG